MKQAIKLAYRNLIGAGLRTWLNVSVLSFSFVIILFYNGLIDGWNKQALRDTIAWETGSGHVQHKSYDPLDPFTILDGHGKIDKVKNKNLTPILVRQAAIYPEGRMMNALMKGLDPDQNHLKIPTTKLKPKGDEIPIVIGSLMQKSTGLKIGDEVLVQWKDKNGTYDATTVEVVAIFKSTVPTIDGGQIYLSINELWKLTGLENEATFLVANEEYKHSESAGWYFKSQDDLLSFLRQVIATERASGTFFYVLLLLIALLAIFDTQVLSIFRRQKEIGTLMALGMTSKQVIRIFTVEGTMYSIFAMLVGLLWGLPILRYFAKNGITYPIEGIEDMGISFDSTMYPVFSLQLIITTILLLIITATIVSYLPSRKIARMDPVSAIKGKLQ